MFKRKRPKLIRSNSALESIKAIVTLVNASKESCSYMERGDFAKARWIIDNTATIREHLDIILKALDDIEKKPDDASSILKSLMLFIANDRVHTGQILTNKLAQAPIFE